MHKIACSFALILGPLLFSYAQASELKSGIFINEACNDDNICTFVSTDGEWINSDCTDFDIETLLYGYLYINYEYNLSGECKVINVTPLIWETGYFKRTKSEECIISVGGQETPFICSQEIAEAAVAQSGELAFWYYPEEHTKTIAILEPEGTANYDERFYFYSAYNYNKRNYCQLEYYTQDAGVNLQCTAEQIDFLMDNKYKFFRLSMDDDQLVNIIIVGDLPQGLAILKDFKEPDKCFFEIEGVALDSISSSEQPLGSHAGNRLEIGKKYFIIYTYGEGGIKYLLYAKEISD